MSNLKITGLHKRYGDIEVLTDINLEVEAGEFIVFVGPSGCGKSTLLRCISGLEPMSDGTMEIGGHDASKIALEKRGVAMVFQSYALYPHMNVFDNIAFSLQLQKMDSAEIAAKVNAVAAKLHLTEYLTRLPALLSGGQRQRVAIGRAIVRDPKIFLFDEPLSNLDASLRVQMRMEIGQLNEQFPDTTMIYVTHDQVEAMTLADRIVVLRDGRIEDIGTPLDLYEKPKTQFIAGFIGSPKMNFLTGSNAAPYDAPTVGVRPEHLVISTQGDQGWAGTVIYVENLGSDTFVFVDIGAEEPLVVRKVGSANLQPGEALRVMPDGDLFYRFDSNGKTI